MIYNINKSFKTTVKRSDRVLEIAESFGLGLNDTEFTLFDNLNIEINQGDVVYITGQSGSGKSQLLKLLVEQMTAEGKKIADIERVTFEDKPLIDQIGKNMHQAIELLSKAGINDAYLAIRSPDELSDGQRYRLRLAKLMESDADVLIADEFGAVLDRVTAKVIAFNAQKLCRATGKTLIVATTHTDMIEELSANVTIVKRFESRVEIIRKES